MLYNIMTYIVVPMTLFKCASKHNNDCILLVFMIFVHASQDQARHETIVMTLPRHRKMFLEEMAVTFNNMCYDCPYRTIALARGYLNIVLIALPHTRVALLEVSR